jgi:hypothetical protein
MTAPVAASGFWRPWMARVEGPWPGRDIVSVIVSLSVA